MKACLRVLGKSEEDATFDMSFDPEALEGGSNSPSEEWEPAEAVSPGRQKRKQYPVSLCVEPDQPQVGTLGIPHIDEWRLQVAGIRVG